MGRPVRAGLTSERIVDVALDLVEEVGLESFSMRELGRRLRVDPMSVYYHLENRDAVLDAMVDRLMSEAGLPTSSERWQDWVRTSAVRFFDLAEAHPRAFALFAVRGIASADAYRPLEALADALIRGGFGEDETWEIVLVFSRYVVGLGVVGLGRSVSLGAKIMPAEPRREGMSAGEFPRLRSIDTAATERGIFMRGIEALIAGFEAELRKRRRKKKTYT